jgi:23S rRNA (adenine2503-C2)-methyltransferase
MPLPSALNLLELSFKDLEVLLVEQGLRPAHAKPLFQAMHHRASANLKGDEGGNFPAPLQRWLEANLGGRLRHDVLMPRQGQVSGDALAQKHLLALEDGQEIETVLMTYAQRHTVCVSTQVGCAMGCVFCATGQMGFVRHLRAGEILAQVHLARRLLATQGQRLRNVVFMGMGEPLHNYDEVIKALHLLLETRGANLGAEHISISTVGVVPGILRLARERQPCNLAVSLHGSSEEERAKLIPVNQRWPLSELMAACRQYQQLTGKRIFFAWTLIEGINDHPEQAQRLIALLRGIDAHVNLIPLNETAGYQGRESAEDSCSRFHRLIQQAGIACTIRQRRGIDVAAGCGQLKAQRRPRQRAEPQQGEEPIAG